MIQRQEKPATTRLKSREVITFLGYRERLATPIVGYTSLKKMVTLSALFERILRMVYGNCHGRYPQEQEGGEWRNGWLLYWQTKSQNQ